MAASGITGSERIMGSELEYGLLVSFGGSALRVAEENEVSVINQILQDCLPSRLSHIDEHWCNGARVYPDNGHPEYSTPESNGPLGLLVNEYAGEQLMGQLFLNALTATDKRLALKNITGCLLSKRVRDYVGNSWGYHLNYCVEASNFTDANDVIDPHALGLAGLHYVCRSIFNGAGTLLSDGRQFSLVQKGLAAETDYGIQTTRMKPVVNLRNNALADNKLYRRIHDTIADPSMSPWVTAMTAGTTSLVLALRERGYDGQTVGLTLGDGAKLHRLIKQVGLAVDPKKPLIPLQDREELVSPLYIEHQLLDNVVDRVEERSLQDEWILKEWDLILNALDKASPGFYRHLNEDTYPIMERLQWPVKLLYLERLQQRQCCKTNEPDMPYSQFADIHFDALVHYERHQDGSISNKTIGHGLRLRQKQWNQYMPPQNVVDEAKLKPPTNRALARSVLVSAMSKGWLDRKLLDWERAAWQSGRIIQLSDPYESMHPDIERAVASFMTIDDWRRTHKWP